ncbi:hypothetical protein Tco_1163563 [Tanacetum coccineum]
MASQDARLSKFEADFNNSISLIRWEEEKSAEDNGMSSNSIVKPDGSDAVVPLKEVKKENKAKNGTKDEPVESAEKKLTQIKEEELVEAPSYQSVGYYHKHKINKNLVEGVIKNQRFNDSLSATRIAKAVIKFDKGIITLRSGKIKISFHKTPETLCRIEKRTKNDIEPIAPTMIVNRLVLEWEERIKLHQEK